MQTSESIGEIATALVAVQGEIQDVEADATNPHLGNQYSPLSTVLRGIRPVLAKHGIALIQSPGLDVGSEGGQVIDRATLTTRLLHTSGQWIEGVARARPATVTEKQARTISPVQTIKGAITALRRTSALAMVGVAERDDDGNAPAEPGAVRSLGTVPATDTDAAAEAGFQAGASDAEKAERYKLIDSILAELSRLNADPSELDKSLNDTYGVQNLAELTTEQMREALSAMTAQPAPGAAS